MVVRTSCFYVLGRRSHRPRTFEDRTCFIESPALASADEVELSGNETHHGSNCFTEKMEAKFRAARAALETVAALCVAAGEAEVRREQAEEAAAAEAEEVALEKDALVQRVAALTSAAGQQVHERGGTLS